MMTNVNPTTNVRYGVISTRSMDPDILDTLWYGVGKDLTYEGFLVRLKQEAEAEAEAYEDDVKVEIGEIDYAMLSNDAYVEREIEEMWGERGYDSREDYVEAVVEARTSEYAAEEPVIEGEYEGVKYRIDWLGGSPIMFLIYSPHTGFFSLCSPCIPGAVSCDESGSFEGYCPPRSWLLEEIEYEEERPAWS